MSDLPDPDFSDLADLADADDAAGLPGLTGHDAHEVIAVPLPVEPESSTASILPGEEPAIPIQEPRFGSSWGGGELSEDDVIEASDGTGYLSPSEYHGGVNGIEKDD